jgi:uncharacterized protein (DUF488 family)
MPAQIRLFTTGYAGHDIDSFVGKLQKHGIESVMDVRQNPVSRKRGFSKLRLSEALVQNGIAYIHLRELGVQRELRDRLRAGACTLDQYFSDFHKYVVDQAEALGEVESRAARQRCCLLCVESRPEECHRAVVAEVLAQRAAGALTVIHL